jgi:malate/lactate dehydrogenase
MAKNRVYSPAMRHDLVRRLYFKAKELHVPMTTLTNQIVGEALDRMAPIHLETTIKQEAIKAS